LVLTWPDSRFLTCLLLPVCSSPAEHERYAVPESEAKVDEIFAPTDVPLGSGIAAFPFLWMKSAHLRQPGQVISAVGRHGMNARRTVPFDSKSAVKQFPVKVR
jgi:hypothetical protein